MEIWKGVPGYEGSYEVSDLGNVRSLNREVIDSRGGIRNYKGKVMKPGLSKGYSVVNLSINGKRRNFNVHVLVAITFLNHIPNGHTTEIDHINAIKLDNRLENLKLNK